MQNLENFTPQIYQEVIKIYEGVIHERERLGFQKMNSQAEDEKFSGRCYAKDPKNRQFRLK